MLRLSAAVALAGVAGALLVAGDASAFCRTTTVGIPANYNPQDRGCFTDGLFLYWKNQCVSYSISEQASSVVPFDTATTIIDAAFARWPAVTCQTGGGPGISVTNIGPSTCTEVRYNANGPNQNLIVFRDDGWPYSDAYNTLGLTTVTFNAETGEIFDADMEINSSQKNLSTTDVVPPNGYDLASVVTHEAGHFLGLAHATSATATMYASYKPGTTALRTLSQDDINGVCTIYPNNAQRSVSPTVSGTGFVASDTCNDAPRHGFTPLCEDDSSKSSGGCAVAAPPVEEEQRLPAGSFAFASVLGVGLIAARRRKR